jgi:hypothetical protein
MNLSGRRLHFALILLPRNALPATIGTRSPQNHSEHDSAAEATRSRVGVQMNSLIPPVSEHRRHWYNTEKSTAALIQSVLKFRPADKLSGDQIWSLITLTWITMGKKHVSTAHWKRYKIPALETLFSKNAAASSDLSVTIDSMNLPDAVAQAAKKETGMVNFRGTWRNSSRKWCRQNRDDLRRIDWGCGQTSSKRPSTNQSCSPD